jgi:hypothetical protein
MGNENSEGETVQQLHYRGRITANVYLLVALRSRQSSYQATLAEIRINMNMRAPTIRTNISTASSACRR